MKIIADDGTEYTPKGRVEAMELAQRLAPDGRGGQHVTKSGRHGFEAREIVDKVLWCGPRRQTREEAIEDYRRYKAGIALEPFVRRYDRAAQVEGKRKALETMRARSPDGQIHIGPPKCRGCGEVGHRRNRCPASGWVKKTYVRKVQTDGQGCAFCRRLGHKAPTCPKRKAALAQAFMRVGAMG